MVAHHRVFLFSFLLPCLRPSFFPSITSFFFPLIRGPRRDERGTSEGQEGIFLPSFRSPPPPFSSIRVVRKGEVMMLEGDVSFFFFSRVPPSRLFFPPLFPPRVGSRRGKSRNVYRLRPTLPSFLSSVVRGLAFSLSRPWIRPWSLSPSLFLFSLCSGASVSFSFFLPRPRRWLRERVTNTK